MSRDEEHCVTERVKYEYIQQHILDLIELLVGGREIGDIVDALTAFLEEVSISSFKHP